MFAEVTLALLKGFLSTVQLFALTLVFALPLGLVISFGSMSRFAVIRYPVKFIIWIIRGTPLMLQLIVVFYGPYYLFGLKLSTGWRLYATLIGFSINYAAYFAEIFRAGIQSIPVGQTEAATVLGYTKVQTFLKIIFPQMVKRTIPPVTNEVITLVKDTSLAFVLAYQEMFTYAKQVSAAMSSLMPLFVAGVFYYVFNLVVTLIMNYIEKRLNYYN